MKKHPKFTVLYNILSDSNWVGTGYEFFDTEKAAQLRYDELKADKNYCPTLRPFDSVDYNHLGAVHRQFWGNNNIFVKNQTDPGFNGYAD